MAIQLDHAFGGKEASGIAECVLQGTVLHGHDCN
jgi:hypothetical protein